ncbi:bluetail domain-containing putative surface protein [Nostoc sp. 'Peltigera membranacea cyanobiont' N6]|uniref:bluetail domain-containing putative surface protein n=1 Tax=Nostoc sp. 'Peltigera membranacea cyanobiont' N6 TaxID=1261031 RepID=UPI000D0C4AD2|nr:bluetail domain-containing putative surface protein [Nostoc sp. 'Peltigera membranacea cyanobiont' N6]AVH64574.1 hemolysin-type calcium-binding repeat-containing protein [Nostoc sp. 'Peltigera membranacea cyanobiont' N6]
MQTTITIDKVNDTFKVNIPTDFSFDKTQKTIFLIHGFKSNPDDSFGDLYKDLQPLDQNANIIRVNWSSISGNSPDDYAYVKGQIDYIALALSNTFKTLNIDPTKTEIIGFSLGAHIAGLIGQDFKKKDPTKLISQIVGLDPAGPLFEVAGEDARISPDDANRVVVIHTSNYVSGLLLQPIFNFTFLIAIATGYLGLYRDDLGTLDIYVKKDGNLYGSDFFAPQQHDLAVKVYQSLVKGGMYGGINQYQPGSNLNYSDPFNLEKLNNPNLIGEYTINLNYLPGTDGNDTFDLNILDNLEIKKTIVVDGKNGDDLLKVSYDSKEGINGIHLGFGGANTIYNRGFGLSEFLYELVKFSSIERFEITGTRYADVFEGRGGNDIFKGIAGSDILNSGAGNDYLDGGADNDTLVGGADNDTLVGGAGNDSLVGGSGNDILNPGYSQGSTDTVDGGEADDLLQVDYSSKNNGYGIHLGFGNTDKIYSRGGAGDNSELVNFSYIERFDITGTQYADVFEVRGGNDIFRGGAGSDILNGGVGNDYLDGGADGDILNGGAGSDILNGGAGNDYLDGGADNDTLVGGAGNDSLVGGAGNDILNPGYSQGSTDTVDGGGGDDDLLQVDYSSKNNDYGIHLGFGNTDKIYSRGGVGDNYELVKFSNIERFDITGTQYDDAFEGRTGNDIFKGDAGSDKLTGGRGKDNLTGGTGADIFVYTELQDSLLNNFDVITDFNANEDKFQIPTVSNFYFYNALDIFLKVDLNESSINTRLMSGNLLGGNGFQPNYTAIFSYKGSRYLVINDATVGFQAGSDAIIEVTGLTGTLKASNFIDPNGNIAQNVLLTLPDLGGGGAGGGDIVSVPGGGAAGGGNVVIGSGLGGNIPQYTATGTPGRDTLIGTSTSDRITGLQGADTITGGGGNDEFVYTNIRDNGDTITDFEIGKDHIVFTQLLDSLVTGGYNGANAIADGYVKVVQGTSTSNFSVQIDADGSTGDDIFRPFITVNLAGTGTLNNPSSFVF